MKSANRAETARAGGEPEGKIMGVDAKRPLESIVVRLRCVRWEFGFPDGLSFTLSRQMQML